MWFSIALMIFIIVLPSHFIKCVSIIACFIGTKVIFRLTCVFLPYFCRISFFTKKRSYEIKSRKKYFIYKHECDWSKRQLTHASDIELRSVSFFLFLTLFLYCSHHHLYWFFLSIPLLHTFSVMSANHNDNYRQFSWHVEMQRARRVHLYWCLP